jgi:hypothetical protein
MKLQLGDRQKFYTARMARKYKNDPESREDKQREFAQISEPQYLMHKYLVLKEVMLADNESGFMNLLGQLDKDSIELLPQMVPGLTSTRVNNLLMAKVKYARQLQQLRLFPMFYSGGSNYTQGNFDTDIPVDIEALIKGIPKLYKLSDTPVYENDKQIIGHVQAGLEYRKALLHFYDVEIRSLKSAAERMKIKRKQQNLRSDIESFEKFLAPKAQMWTQKEPRDEKEQEVEPVKSTPPRRKRSVSLSRDPATYSDPRNRSFDDGWYNEVMAMKARNLSPSASLHLSRAPSRWGSPISSRFSVAPMVQMPLAAHHIIRLRNIYQPPGEEHKMFTRDHQIYGFEFNDWLRQNVQAFPIASMLGNKQSFGKFIKSNLKKREFTFRVTRKSTENQISALLDYINMKLPHMKHMSTFVQRKKWDKIKNVKTVDDLHEFILKHLKSKPRISVKLKW